VTENVSLPAALLAGLISFFSPCVLPLVPIYLGYITGTAVSGLDSSKRINTLIHALCFVLGFGLLFVALGATAGLLGSLIYPILPYLVKGGGVLLIVLGMHMTGLITIPFLAMEKRLDVRQSGRKTYWSSFLVGVVFAAGWTPCVGPVLSGILMLAADSQTVSRGATLLALYTLGLGLPFLVVAALVDVAVPALRKLSKYLRIVSVVGGVLLILMGFLLLTGLFTQVTAWFNALTNAGW
jgi:cytochrome c-type biogenesis protein